MSGINLMNQNRNTTRSLFFAAPLALFLALFSSCVTSEREVQLQGSINQLDSKVNALQAQVNARDQQVTNATENLLNSKSNLDQITSQMELTQGSVDELRHRVSQLEQVSGGVVAGGVATSAGTSLLSAGDSVVTLQRKVARLELIEGTAIPNSRKGKLPPNVKNAQDASKVLKGQFDNEQYKQLNETATAILNAQSANAQMLGTALEYRGEGRFQTKDYRGAAIDLSTFAEQYPQSPRVSRALLLAGDSYVYLKMYSVALGYYQEAAQLYPNTPEGKAAAGRVQGLSQKISTPESSGSTPATDSTTP